MSEEEKSQIELLKMAIQVTETILNDKTAMRQDALYKAKDFCNDSDASDYMKLLMYIKQELSRLLKS
jgi:hypothetical protein